MMGVPASSREVVEAAANVGFPSLHQAADTGLLSPELAAGIQWVKGVAAYQGLLTGQEQAKSRLINLNSVACSAPVSRLARYAWGGIRSLPAGLLSRYDGLHCEPTAPPWRPRAVAQGDRARQRIARSYGVSGAAGGGVISPVRRMTQRGPAESGSGLTVDIGVQLQLVASGVVVRINGVVTAIRIERHGFRTRRAGPRLVPR
jgi:hypothetical protein